MPHVTVTDGVRLFVQDTGTGSPVVFVPGLGLDHTLWHREVERLSLRHRVLCLDQRGHGRSDKPAAGYGVDELAADLLAVLDELEVGACTLVGWSFGGQVAFRAAAAAPERVAQLVLVCSNAVRASRSDRFPFGRSPQELEDPIVDAELRDRVAARRTTIAGGFHRPPERELLDRLVEISLAMPGDVAVACYRSMLYADLTEDIQLVGCRVLQIVGATDPVHSARGARWLNERLADAELVEIAECGHYPMLEAPEPFSQALADFVSRSVTSR